MHTNPRPMIPCKKLLLILSLLPQFALQAQNRTVWQIGKFDESPVEFSRAAGKSITFRIGTSEAQKDWPGRQETGDTNRIVFSLPSVEGVYSLKIGTLIEQARVPALLIDVNGHSGTFYLHPKLSYSRSDFSYAFDPHEAQSRLSISLPSTFLKQGENVIAITCKDNPATPAGEEEIGGISYDALSLEQQPSETSAANALETVVEPTIFYHQSPGGLTEVVDAFIRFGKPRQAGTVELEVKGKRYNAELTAGSFGEQRVSFDVPEWTGTVTGRLRVGSDAKQSKDVSLTAQRKWTIFVVPHTHLDVGYTDYQGKVAETQARVLSQADSLIQQHPDFRFSMDGSWNLQQLLETRPKAKQEEVLNLIRNGKMAMPVQYCNLLTGYASLETLYRSLYDSKTYARRYELPYEYANITDVPTYSGSYPSVLASSGVKYWVAAANNDRAPVFYYDHWNEKSPFWWEGPDGKKVLFWYSRHYEQVQVLFGLTPQLSAVRESLPIYLQAYSKPTYKPDVALLYGTQVENTDLVPASATFATDWNKQYAFPKLNYATFPDFFRYVDLHYAADLPTFKGDGGGYWEDGIGSDAVSAATDRQNQNRALSAEVLSSVTHSVDANLNPPRGLFTDIWRNIILFSEHTWLSYNSVSQPDHDESIKQLRVKDGRAETASLEIEDVMNRSLSQLADRIHVPANTLVVFNSLNWRRDGLVETDLFEHPTLVDLTTQQKVPLQVLYSKQRFLHVRFLAKDLPAVGYKCFAITYDEHGAPETLKSNDKTIENNFYRVTVDESTGALASIYDKQLQREIVDSNSPYKFGQYLYVTGGDGDTQMINPFPALAPGELTIHPASQGKFIGVEQTAWGQSIRLSSTSVKTPRIQTEVLLFNDEKKLEFRFHVQKDFTTDKEAVYFAFPAGVWNPSFSFATQQGWVDPSHDLMKGGSLEWFNVQQWMAVHDANLAVGIVPLDASLASFGDINRGKWPGEFHPKSGTIFSYAMNNYWHTNYRAGQGGDFTFRYTVTSSPQLDGGALSHLGLEELRPIEVNYVVGQDKVGDPQRPLPAGGQGFIETTGQDVTLITWKEAEDGNDMILRIQETSGKPANTTLHFTHSHIGSAHLCSGVEDNVREISVENDAIALSFKPFEVLTLRITVK
ncbi:MAG: polysaccharide lyase family protein [Acidobacteriota bacterium]|nr:polysaccharide lyase family protein [Acidobacteriota bacterium]